MGIKKDVTEGIELWRQRPLRNSLLLLGGAALVALGMAADTKWGPDHTSETAATILVDAHGAAP